MDPSPSPPFGGGGGGGGGGVSWITGVFTSQRTTNVTRKMLHVIATDDDLPSLQWRHNGHDGVSIHQPHDCLLSRLFRRRSKKTAKLRVTGPCPHKWPVTRKMFSFDDVIMLLGVIHQTQCSSRCGITDSYLVRCFHYSDVIMSAIASQITGVAVVYSTVCSDTDQGKHQSSASLAFVRGIHRWSVNSPHKGPVTRKMFPFGDVTMH